MPDNFAANLAWLSRVMAGLATVGLFVSPLAVVVGYVWPGSTDALMFDVDHTGALLSERVPLAFRLAALVCSLGGEAFTVWAFWALRSLFLLYARGEVFSQRALACLNHVAVALFAGVIVSFVLHAPIHAPAVLAARGRGTGKSPSISAAATPSPCFRPASSSSSPGDDRGRRAREENAKFV
ncbi:MAG: DUF2975 domain-containing protein [Rhizomicrobium sp.]